MTDRDHFAAAALTGMLSRPQWMPDECVPEAYRLADAMLRERDSRTGQKLSKSDSSRAVCPERESTNHDAVPAATAPVDRLVRLGATDRESVGTDKAEPLTRDCGTGNTTDRPQPVKDSDFDRSKPIRDARLAALEELSALDQQLELEHGITGNPMIKARHNNESICDVPCVTASCPRCGLTFPETVDDSVFLAEEIRAVQCGANALRVAATRVASYDDSRDMELMADRLEGMLNRMGGLQ